ncbi:MAG: hypothetical protein DRP64_12360 [Verrucomicrobia bacterium]|nr:MAG: hypothetical protein DRP64_12360 [Verrucomicrobiota bacterium]
MYPNMSYPGFLEGYHIVFGINICFINIRLDDHTISHPCHKVNRQYGIIGMTIQFTPTKNDLLFY